MTGSISVTAAFSTSKTPGSSSTLVTFTDDSTFSPAIANDWTLDRTERDGSGDRWQYEVRDQVTWMWRFENGSPASASGGSVQSVSYLGDGTYTASLTVSRMRLERRRVFVENNNDDQAGWDEWEEEYLVEQARDTVDGTVEIDNTANRKEGALSAVFDPNLDPDGDPTTDLDRKYWRIVVPDFNGTLSETASSYLRLGAVEKSVYNKWAGVDYTWEEHAGSPPAPQFDGETAAEAFPPGSGEDLAALVMDFDDDYRDRGGSGDGNVRSTDQRIAESVRLHTRGGWRDHTDGNRISTTRGDKVEVIAGNFKRIVLGRRQFADGDAEAGANQWGDTLDVSGGIGMDIDQTPFATTDIRWDDNLETWKVTDSGSNGYYVSDTSGLSIDHFKGRQESYSSGSSYSYHGDYNANVGHSQGFHQSVSIPGLDLSWPSAVDSPLSPGDEEQKVVDVTEAEVWNYHKGNLYERSANTLIDSQAFWGTQRSVEIGGASGSLEIAAQRTALEIAINTVDVAIKTALEINLGAFVGIRIGPEVDINTSSTTEMRLSRTNLAAADSGVSASATKLSLLYKIN